MAHFLPPELVRQVNKLEWPNTKKKPLKLPVYMHSNNNLQVAQDWWIQKDLKYLVKAEFQLTMILHIALVRFITLG